MWKRRENEERDDNAEKNVITCERNRQTTDWRNGHRQTGKGQILKDKETGRHVGRQTGRQGGGQAGRQASRNKDEQTEHIPKRAFRQPGEGVWLPRWCRYPSGGAACILSARLARWH